MMTHGITLYKLGFLLYTSQRARGSSPCDPFDSHGRRLVARPSGGFRPEQKQL